MIAPAKRRRCTTGVNITSNVDDASGRIRGIMDEIQFPQNGQAGHSAENLKADASIRQNSTTARHGIEEHELLGKGI